MKYEGFTVNLTTEVSADYADTPLKEYGIKRPKAGMNRHIASCYVESVEGLRFAVQIKADDPFPYRQDQLEATDQALACEGGAEVKEVGNQKIKSEFEDAHSTKLEDGHYQADDCRRRISARKNSIGTEYPYNFVVGIHIDGKDSSEIERYVYIDPSYQPALPGLLRHRQYLNHSLKRDRNGRVRKYYWIFQDAGGIGELLDSINNLAIDESTRPVDVDRELTSALASAQLHNENDTSSFGQIKVVIRRVIINRDVRLVGESWSGFVSPENAKGMHGGNVKHSAAYQRDGIYQHPQTTSLLSYRQYVKGEEPYATFIFYYRSRDVLKKFGFVKEKSADELAPAGPIAAPAAGLNTALVKHKREPTTSFFGDWNKRVKEDVKDDVKEIAKKEIKEEDVD
ncbi:hypothetical protein MPH_07702 [Macrophomina phaseolina MS6]|uniref:DUF7918 domain-containing protein n=1 Tax=Macrophomina phaseolina (strain MS6) TaxID=1126212 RepID=K2SE25_MACPH|nr:hypothetical protein MPH_07702 [Macrophomina phaseolina MS6]